MKKLLFAVSMMSLILTSCGTATDHVETDEQILESIHIEETDTESIVEEETKVNEDDLENENIGEMYYHEPHAEDILMDEETGLQYVKNQLLISAFPETEKSQIEEITKEINAEIVGMIELTADYQIEFKEDKSLDELQEIADYINSYAFISNVTLNLAYAEEGE